MSISTDSRPAGLSLLAGGAEHVLCVFGEGSLRTPAEAKRLSEEGCTEAAASPRLVEFANMLREDFAPFADACVELGRIRLCAASSEAADALEVASELASLLRLGQLSPRGHTECFLPWDDVLSLGQALHLLDDQSISSVSVYAGRTRLVVRMTERELELRVIGAPFNKRKALRLLGLTEPEGELFMHRFLAGHPMRAGRLLMQVVAAVGAPDELCVRLKARPNLRLASRLEPAKEALRAEQR